MYIPVKNPNNYYFSDLFLGKTDPFEDKNSGHSVCIYADISQRNFWRFFIKENDFLISASGADVNIC